MDIGKPTLKFIWRGQRPRIINTISKGKKSEDWLPGLLESYSGQDSVMLAKT